MHGNMKLIVELFNLDMVSGNIVKTCLDELFQELSVRNIEVLCSMLDVLTSNEVAKSKKSRTDTPENAKASETTPLAQNEKSG